MHADPSEIHWYTSSYSAGGNECVETAQLPGGPVGVRDSTDPAGPILIFGPRAWDSFLADVTDGGLGRA